jgi:hypothetical protein
MLAAQGLVDLLEAMGEHGPDRASVVLSAEAIATATDRVQSGEQLRSHLAAEVARIRRRYGSTDGHLPEWIARHAETLDVDL